MCPRVYTQGGDYVNAALWFLQHNIPVFPIRPRDKTPACASWDDYVASPDEVKTWVNFGVRLGAYGVVDTDAPEAEAWVVAHLPVTPFMVDTARGCHRYYRLRREVPKFIRRDGLSIEFRNRGQYVVGPGSIHSSGAVYMAREWSWDHRDVPHFPAETFAWDDRPGSARGSVACSLEGYRTPTLINAGERHDELFRMCRAFKIRGVPLAGALEACLIENAIRCRPPLPRRAIEKHLSRAYHHANASGWIGYPMTAWALVLSLAESGFAVESLVAAALGLDPAFDPDHPNVPHAADATVDAIERDIHGASVDDLPTTYMEDGVETPLPPGQYVLRDGHWVFKPARTKKVVTGVR